MNRVRFRNALCVNGVRGGSRVYMYILRLRAQSAVRVFFGIFVGSERSQAGLAVGR